MDPVGVTEIKKNQTVRKGKSPVIVMLLIYCKWLLIRSYCLKII